MGIVDKLMQKWYDSYILYKYTLKIKRYGGREVEENSKKCGSDMYVAGHVGNSGNGFFFRDMRAFSMR